MALSLRAIETFYGNSQALFGVDLDIADGAAVTLLGRNGMGKTTTVNTIIGRLPCRRGAIHHSAPHRARQRIDGWPPHRIAQRGIGLVPEGREIFPNLNVRENLVAAAANHGALPTPWTLDSVLDLFPQLRPRLRNMGDQLSGGEQQMLAIGRALMLNPTLLILDEATEGLAPLIQQELWRKLHEIKRTGIALLLIDKNLEALCELADDHCIIEKGVIVWRGSSGALRAAPELKARYLGV